MNFTNVPKRQTRNLRLRKNPVITWLPNDPSSIYDSSLPVGKRVLSGLKGMTLPATDSGINWEVWPNALSDLNYNTMVRQWHTSSGTGDMVRALKDDLNIEKGPEFLGKAVISGRRGMEFQKSMPCISQRQFGSSASNCIITDESRFRPPIYLEARYAGSGASYASRMLYPPLEVRGSVYFRYTHHNMDQNRWEGLKAQRYKNLIGAVEAKGAIIPRVMHVLNAFTKAVGNSEGFSQNFISGLGLNRISRNIESNLNLIQDKIELLAIMFAQTCTNPSYQPRLGGRNGWIETREGVNQEQLKNYIPRVNFAGYASKNAYWKNKLTQTFTMQTSVCGNLQTKWRLFSEDLKAHEAQWAQGNFKKFYDKSLGEQSPKWGSNSLQQNSSSESNNVQSVFGSGYALAMFFNFGTTDRGKVAIAEFLTTGRDVPMHHYFLNVSRQAPFPNTSPYPVKVSEYLTNILALDLLNKRGSFENFTYSYLRWVKSKIRQARARSLGLDLPTVDIGGGGFPNIQTGGGDFPNIQTGGGDFPNIQTGGGIPDFQIPGSNLRPDFGGGQDVGGQDVGGQDVGGQDVGGQDVGGQDVGGQDVGGQDVGGQDVGGQDGGGQDGGGQDGGGQDGGGQDGGGQDADALAEGAGVDEKGMSTTTKVLIGVGVVATGGAIWWKLKK